MYRSNSEEKKEFLFRWLQYLNNEAIEISEDRLYLIKNNEFKLCIDRYNAEKQTYNTLFLKQNRAEILVTAYILADSKEDAELQLKFLQPKISTNLVNSKLSVKKSKRVTGKTKIINVPVIFNDYKFNLYIKIDRLYLKANGSLDELNVLKKLVKPYKGENNAN